MSKEVLESQACVEKRERLFRKLQKTYDMVKELPNNEDVFLARVNCIDDEYKFFNEIQDKLARLNLIIPNEDKVSIEGASDSYDDMYYIIVAKSKEIANSKQSCSNVNESVVQDAKSLRPKLPPIEIPKFKGDLEKFPAFKSLYDTLVHNTELAAIQKFSFLKSYVEYPASCVIENFDFVEGNYQLAYDALVERYTDKRLVGTHFLNKLFQFKPLTNASPNNLRNFLDVFCVHYESLKALKISDLSDFIVFNLAMKVLDADTRRLFEDKHSTKDFPSFNDLILFVKEQYKVASIVQAPNVVSKPSGFVPKSQMNLRGGNCKPTSNTKSFMSNAQESITKCAICKSDHKTSSCESFTKMSPMKRFEMVKSLKLCFACLGSHDRSNCRSKFTCRVCKNKNHHTLLHRDQAPLEAKSEPRESCSKAEANVSETPPTNALNCHVQSPVPSSSTTCGLLSTVKCRVQSLSGEWVECRMIVDPASESSFITESLVQALQLPRKRYSVDIIGVGSSSFPNNRGMVSCKVAPRHTANPMLSVEAIVLQTISSNMPKFPINSTVRKRFSSFHLADPDFDKPGRIDFLLGVQHYSEILSESLVHIKGEPAALDTIFGFIIFGKIPTTEAPTRSVSMLTHTPSLDEMLRRFWEVEEPPQASSKVIDLECEQLFSQTTTRDNLGRYEVSLPFIGGTAPDSLGSTRDVAHKRLLSLEHRLSRNPDLKVQYNANLQDYVDQDHMRLATTQSDYLLTHHAVLKESSTTKVRVVFNGSEKSDTRKSLNEFLSPGSKLQSDISVLLLSFRMQPVTLIADLKQMYRCIRLKPSDTKYTHLLWRTDISDPVTEWEITTLPFGLTCSPYLAQRTIQQLVSDEGELFPLASKALTSSIYIDDIVCAVSSEDEAVRLYTELSGLLTKGGFSLHKVSSNSAKLLSHIPKDCKETPVSFDSSHCVKLLGFLWDPTTDEFFYKLSLENPVTTKRGILSQVARIYDINGYLTPIIFWIKYFIQRLWLAGIGWDEDLPETLKLSWLEFYSQLSEILSIKIPRFINYSNPLAITLIGFSDASEKGYSASVYLRVQSQDNQVQVHLLKAKSKVAPLKTVTIPKLELNGAVLLSKLIHSLSDLLSNIPVYDLYCFTDSTTVLSWLRKPPHLLKTYVSNRVIQILDVISPTSWRHVSGKLNPSDIASRGIFPKQLTQNDLWWHGPPFLIQPIYEWPNKEITIIDPLPETKPDSVSLVTTQDKDRPIRNDSIIEGLLDSHSSLIHVQRVLSYVLRFISNLSSKKSERKVGSLTHLEMEDALKAMILCTQSKYFSSEIRCVQKGLHIEGPLQHLTPFLNKDGLLMVGGRLAAAPIPSASKNPYLIHRKSKLAELICSHYHLISLHGGQQLMQSLIQRKFWIPGIRYLLKSITFKCVTCYRFKAKPLEPFMSKVPSFRFKMSRAFVNTGVDLAGPFLLKDSKRRNARTQKCWLVLFICLSTRAVYIDLVSEISTAAFLSALDRFISRRGIPSELYSDLGTNFVGAARELKTTYNTLINHNEELSKYCELRKINWRFNPPSAPNFGGSWESAIRSMKHHLKRIIANRPLTYEEFSTLIARIEAILNSRPLCPISSDPSDGFDYLTPGHFLVGAPLILSRPEQDNLEEPINYNSRWQLITRSVQDIWRRWAREYIQTLINRPKWDKYAPNLTIGEMVLLYEKKLPPTSWTVGRVSEVYTGSDGVVRVVKVKTPSGQLIRPVNKLCVLPIQE